MAVTKPVSSAPGVEGVFATQVAPVAASAKVMSVKVPPTSMARVPAVGEVTPGIVEQNRGQNLRCAPPRTTQDLTPGHLAMP